MTPNDVSLQLLEAVKAAAMGLRVGNKIDHTVLTIGVADMLGELIMMPPDNEKQLELLHDALQCIGRATGVYIAIAKPKQAQEH